MNRPRLQERGMAETEPKYQPPFSRLAWPSLTAFGLVIIVGILARLFHVDSDDNVMVLSLLAMWAFALLSPLSVIYIVIALLMPAPPWKRLLAAGLNAAHVVTLVVIVADNLGI